MVGIDSSIFRFKSSEVLVMLYLLTHADENGVCNTSYSLLAHDLDLSVQNCRTIINRLKTLNEITTTSTNKISRVNLLKYGSYTQNTNNHQQAKIISQQAKIEELSAKIKGYEEQIKDLQSQVEELSKKKRKSTAVSVDKSLSLEERAKLFYNSLIPFVDSKGGQYPKEMIRAFYNYWSEPNKSKAKMRWELEKTWEVGRRLTTWANNNRNFKNNNNGYGRETITDKIQRSAAESSEFSRKLKAQREANLGNGDSEKVW